LIKIFARTIPHSCHRYETVGDYWEEGFADREVRASEMGDEDMEFLVLLHEMIEQHLCLKRGIPEETIKAFDEEFERNRVEGNTDEPGHSLNAPYRREHVFSEKIEMQIAEELGVNWQEYTDRVNAL